MVFIGLKTRQITKTYALRATAITEAMGIPPANGIQYVDSTTNVAILYGQLFKKCPSIVSREIAVLQQDSCTVVPFLMNDIIFSNDFHSKGIEKITS